MYQSPPAPLYPMADPHTSPQCSRRPAGHLAALVGLASLLTLAVLLGPTGCAAPTRKPVNAPPPVTYTGPDFLRGTVTSLCRIRQYEPQLVSGYGLVVGLDGTGSSEIPAFLRQHMINALRQRGVGSPRMRQRMPEQYKRFMRMSPEELLMRKDTAIVAVYALVPPGAVEGTSFDVLVQALPDTQTTSLAGGLLWTTKLQIDGTDPSLPFSHEVADAYGPIYLDPHTTENTLDPSATKFDKLETTAVVVAGGHTLRRRRIELILNQPSWTQSRNIADRINSRFRAEPDERIETAKAQTDQLIRLNIPRRFADDPNHLIDLISHLYIEGGIGFAPRKAEELVHVLEKDPQYLNTVVLAWRALGKPALPVLRDQYEHPKMYVRLAALEAGAALGDESTSAYLSELAKSEDVDVRKHVAQALIHLPQSRRGGYTLKQLLDDPNRDVRISAYESLALIHNQRGLIQRLAIQGNGDSKFIIDQVPAKRPMIYITHEHKPRIVIFDGELGFNKPMLATLWDSRLSLIQEKDDMLRLYYQKPHQIKGKDFKLEPTVATLAYVLGNHPRVDGFKEGLDLTYSQVVNVIYTLCKQGHIDAPIEVKRSALADAVEKYREEIDPERRPEISDEPVTVPGRDTVGYVPPSGQSSPSDNTINSASLPQRPETEANP